MIKLCCIYNQGVLTNIICFIQRYVLEQCALVYNNNNNSSGIGIYGIWYI